MEIKGFIQNSLLEWEGRICSVLFLPCCNLRCRYCHANHLVFQPERLERVPREQIFAYLAHQKGWIDGVVITGGEPTLHGDALIELVQQLRELSLDVMVETNGTQPDIVRQLVEGRLLDAIAMDTKAPLNPDDYERVCGTRVNTDRVRDSLQVIKGSGIEHEFRITLVPGLVGADELRAMAPDLHGAHRVALQNFMPDHCLDSALYGRLPYCADELDEFERILKPFAQRIVVRGRDHASRVRSRAS